ncbi:MAG TPA: hypothetical protein PKX66_05180, partial [Rectinema sp.]|nr:hypothetical protein [Rectinema sp.]
ESVEGEIHKSQSSFVIGRHNYRASFVHELRDFGQDCKDESRLRGYVDGIAWMRLDGQIRVRFFDWMTGWGGINRIIYF